MIGSENKSDVQNSNKLFSNGSITGPTQGYCILFCFVFSEPKVGFAGTVYTAVEGEERVSVCVAVKNATPDECLANFTFNINFTTSDDSAGSHTSKRASSYYFSLHF